MGRCGSRRLSDRGVHVRGSGAQELGCLHRAEETGTLEPGKLADIAVLDRDIVGSPESPVDPELIRAAEVVMTLVGGKVVYTR